jgi:hypothetical protein
MLFVLIALLQSTPASSQETKATLQSCETTEKGWVCHYQIPSTSTVHPLDPAPMSTMVPPATAVFADPAPPQAHSESSVQPPAASSSDDREAARRTRLIARCADAKWYSPCLPGERKEAETLRANARLEKALNDKVTGLLGEKHCDEAVKAALDGGDLDLATKARAFCAASKP